jgi:hypothetical protein
MGLETKCNALIAKQAATGKLHVDSKELSFQAKDLKWTLALKPTPNATTKDGWLQVPGAKFELGPAATKWLDKILNPPSRLSKLGLTPSTTLWIGGEAPREFLNECEQNQIPTTSKLERANIALYFLSTPDHLHAAPPPSMPLWLIYPKGGKTIKESEVMAWAKQHGVGASKTLSFDEQRTGLRFGAKKS